MDVVIRGEGEFSLPSVIKNINNEEALKNIRGITFKTDDNRIIRNDDSEKIKIEDLEKCPFPTYENLPDKKYTHLPLETSRGCKYNCIFCSVVHKKGWRGYCKEIVLERVQKIKNSVINKTIDGKGIYFVDDCFSANQERALELLNDLKETGLGFKYGIECRINDLLKEGFLKKLPKDLISFIQIGVEAGYDDGLKKVRKGITVNQVIECSKLIYESGYEKQAFMSFIIGFPWEGYDEIEETIQTIAYISSTYAIVCNVSWLWICASDLWEQRMEYGITVNDDIYDDPLWITDRTIFDLTHPRISHETYQKVENLIEAYQQMGYQISHVKMWID